MTTYDTANDNEFLSEKQDFNSTTTAKKTPKKLNKKPKEITTNTVTTFSRMEEEQEKRNDEFNDIYGNQEEQDNRVPCSNWGRKFNPDRLPVHQKSWNNQKKRKVFNSQKKRAVDGVMGITNKKKEKKSPKLSKKELASQKKAKWKREHEDLVKAIKMSRLIKKVQEEGGDITKLPWAPPTQNDDYVECQYWYRRYAPQVAERHIPHCKNMINRPKPPPHILKRLKEEEAKKKAKREKRKKPKTLNRNNGNRTSTDFGKDLQSETQSETFNTQYPFKPKLNQIREVNEDNGNIFILFMISNNFFIDAPYK